MKTLLRLIFVLLIVSVVAAIVASVVSKKKLESMSDDEIREFLGLKLTGKVGEDQLVTIQDAVISGVRGKQPKVDHYIDDVEEALDELDHVAEESAEEVSDGAQAAVETAKDAIEAATE